MLRLILSFIFFINSIHAFNLKDWILSELQKLMEEEEKIQEVLCGKFSIFPFHPSVQIFDGQLCSIPEVAPIVTAFCFGAPGFDTSGCFGQIKKIYGTDPYAQIEKIASEVRQIDLLKDIACRIATKRILPPPQQRFMNLICTGTTSDPGQTTPTPNPATEATPTVPQSSPQQPNLATLPSAGNPVEVSNPTPQSAPVIQAIVENAIKQDLNAIIANKVQQVVGQAVEKALSNLGQQQPLSTQDSPSIDPRGKLNFPTLNQAQPIQQEPPENYQSSQGIDLRSSQTAVPNAEHNDAPQDPSENMHEGTRDPQASIPDSLSAGEVE